MNPATFRLILLLSSAHALVHVYELAFPSVEELVAADYQVGKPTMGLMGNCWRFPFGAGALLSGWLVDRYGAKWPLVFYLLGCAATSALVCLLREVGGTSTASLQPPRSIPSTASMRFWSSASGAPPIFIFITV